MGLEAAGGLGILFGGKGRRKVDKVGKGALV
jgi:hypothetical protein